MVKILIIESDLRWRRYAIEGLRGHDYQVTFFDSIRHVRTNLSDLEKYNFRVVVVGGSVDDRSGNDVGPGLADAIRTTYLDSIKIVQWSVNRKSWADFTVNKGGNQAALGNTIRRACQSIRDLK